MDRDSTTRIEERIVEALHSRAARYDDAVVEQPGVDVSPAPGVPRRPLRRTLVATVAALALLSTIVGVWALSREDPRQPDRPATIAGPAFVPPVNAGDELALEQVSPSPALRGSVMRLNAIPGAKVIALRAGDAAPIGLGQERSQPSGATTTCVRVERPAGEKMSSVASSCGSTGIIRVFGYPKRVLSSEARVYNVWIDVPAVTAYVTFESARLRAWQRPVHGAVVFPVDGEPVDITVRAFDVDGNELKAISARASYDGAAVLPGQPEAPWSAGPIETPAVASPTEECRQMVALSRSTASLRVFDHASGQTATLTVDQFCDRTEIQEFTDQELQKAGVGASITFEGGRWQISYRVLNVTSENGMETHEVTREELPLDEVRRRVENVRAEEPRAG